jgi:hypothetical protein
MCSDAIFEVIALGHRRSRFGSSGILDLRCRTGLEVTTNFSFEPEEGK